MVRGPRLDVELPILLLTYSIHRIKGLECVKWVIQKPFFYILLGPVFSNRHEHSTLEICYLLWLFLLP